MEWVTGDPGCNRDSPSKKLSPDSNEQSQRLNQRMRDLYDFKTENEWPKRAINARRQNAWISKSSSEEDRGSQPIRRNSQDLEFNDRLNVIKVSIYVMLYKSDIYAITREKKMKIETFIASVQNPYVILSFSYVGPKS